MATKKDLLDEINFLTDLISNRVRTISAGILAFCWLFILQSISNEGTTPIIRSKLLMVPVILAILALVADMAQYWSGYLTTRSMLRKIETEKKNNINYEEKSFLYVIRTTMFYAKQLLMLAATIWLLVVFGEKVITMR